MKRILISILLLSSILFAGGLPSWYYKIKNTSLQRNKFVEIMLPMIKKANKITLKRREFVINFFNKLEKKGFGGIDKSDLRRLVRISKIYNIKNLFDKDDYLLKIDKVPESLALTQAAIESAWGKSRFAIQADNLFGQWTYGAKGIIPQDRAEGKIHKIRIFNSLQASVDAYVNNLNSNRAYKNFRIQRYQSRILDEKFSGVDAAQTMKKYSQLRDKYVQMIRKFMVKHKFLRYDTEEADKGEAQSLYAFN